MLSAANQLLTQEKVGLTAKDAKVYAKYADAFMRTLTFLP